MRCARSPPGAPSRPASEARLHRSDTALDSPPPEPRVHHPRRAGRQLLLRLHFYVGVFVGPFLLVAVLSGALHALTPQLERLVHADALTGTTVERPLSLQRRVRLAQEAAVVDEVRFADYSAPAELARWGIGARMGVLVGTLLPLLGIGLLGFLLLDALLAARRRR